MASRLIHPPTDDPSLTTAVALLDAGDVDGLRAHLAASPEVVRARAAGHTEYDQGYFAHATLLHFVAANPIFDADQMMPNAVASARVILAAGADVDAGCGDQRDGTTLGLVVSGMLPRQAGVQIELIDLLCEQGADPDRAMLAALGHQELDAVRALLRCGAALTAPVAATLGLVDDLRRLLPASDAHARHQALALAVSAGQTDPATLLIESGEPVDRFNPHGCHGHSTPLHQAALAGDHEMVRLLLDRGARLDVKDTVFGGTPAGWAEHGGHPELAKTLRP